MGLVNSLFVDFTMHHNKRLRAPGLVKLTINSLVACSRKCYETNDCLSFGFTPLANNGFENCILNSEHSQTRDLTEQAGHVYGEGEFIPARKSPRRGPDVTVPDGSVEPLTTGFSAHGIGENKYSANGNTAAMTSTDHDAATQTSATITHGLDTTHVGNDEITTERTLSPAPEEVLTTDTLSPSPEEVLTTDTLSHTPEEVLSTDTLSPSPEKVLTTDTMSPAPEKVLTTDTLSPAPEEVLTTDTRSPAPEEVLTTDTRSPAPEEVLTTDTLSPAPEDAKVVSTLRVDTAYTIHTGTYGGYRIFS
jgi:hypothetical protein